MNQSNITIMKYISILQRNYRRYYDLLLEQYHIGSGQQFFLLRIKEHEGIAMYELARIGQFDKGTITKAVQKLADQGYVRMEVDNQDKRIRRLYTTPAAEELIDTIYSLREDWKSFITSDLTEEEYQWMFENLEKMAEKSASYLQLLTNEKGDEPSCSKNQ